MTAGIQELIASWAPSADLSCPAAMLQALANSSGIPLQDGFFQLMKNQFRILSADQFEADPYLAAMKDLPDQIREGRFTLAMVSYEKGELLAYDAPSGSGLSDAEATGSGRPGAEAPDSCISGQEATACGHFAQAGEVLIVPKIGCFDRRVRFPSIYEEEIPWMSVCPSEMNTLREPLEDARAFLRQRKDSRVLVLGLGLGYYPFLISLEDSVKEIVIVEYSREIIDLFEKYLLPRFPYPGKIRIVQDDAFDYLRRVQPGEFDYVFSDTWESQFDGAKDYLRIKRQEARLNPENAEPRTGFGYWIEPQIRAYLKDEGILT